MRAIEGHDLELFTINTGEFYQYHLFLARKHFSAHEWHRHLTDRVIPLYSRQVEPVTYDYETVANVAKSLKDYYERHLEEASHGTL